MDQESAQAQKTYRGTMPIPVLMHDGNGQSVPVSKPDAVFAGPGAAALSSLDPSSGISQVNTVTDPVISSVDASFAQIPNNPLAQSSITGVATGQPTTMPSTTTTGTDLEGTPDYTLQATEPNEVLKPKRKIPWRLVAATAALVLVLGGFASALLLGVGRNGARTDNTNGLISQSSGLLSLDQNQLLTVNGQLVVKQNTDLQTVTAHGLATLLQGAVITGNVQVNGSVSQNGNPVCDQSNNCGYLTGNSGVSGFNGLTGAVTLQGTANQVSVSTAGSSVTLTTPQDIATTSSPSFAGARLSGANALTLGSSGNSNGAILFKNATNNSTLTLQSGVVPSDVTFTLPTTDGSNGSCLQTNGSGALSFQACTGGPGGGVTSLTGTAHQISVSSPTGNVTLSLPQDIDAASSPTFNGLTVSGSVLSNNFVEALAGTDLNVNAGSDNIIFTANGITFNLPNSGPSSQTICTTGITCVSGGGQAVVLAPGAAQTDTSTDTSIQIDKTGASGNLLGLTVNGGQRLTLDYSGNQTLSGDLAINGGDITSSVPLTINGGGTLTLSNAVSALSTLTVGSTATIQGSSITIGNSSQAGSLILNDGASNTATISPATLGQSTVYTLPDPGGASDIICLQTFANCSGSGGLSGSGTNNKVAKFTGVSTLADSTITDDGTNVSLSGDLAINGGDITSSVPLTINGGGTLTLSNAVSALSTLTVGSTATIQGSSITIGNSSQAGSLILNDGASNTATISPATLGQSTVYTLPDPGGASASICLTTGNCAGSGTGVTTVGGSANRIAKFTGSQAIGDSTITDDGTNVSLTGDLTVQGGDAYLGTASSANGIIHLQNSTNALTLNLSAPNQTGGNATVSVPNTSGVNDTFCLATLANCAGGSGVSGSGTTNRVAKFTGSTAVGNSTITDDGTNVSLTGALTVQGASSLTLGTATTNTGAILLKNASNSNTLTLQSGATGSNLTLTLPTADGINGDCLLTNGSGVLSFGTCTGGGGGSSGVTSLDGLTGVLTINNSTGSGSAITIDNASTSAKGIASFNSTNFNVTSGAVNTIQDIATTSSPTFVAQTLTGSGTGLTLSGAPSASASSSLLNLGGAISGGSANGTYIGINPASSSADFLNFQIANSSKLKVANTGAISIGGTQFIDGSRNLSNIGTIGSGAITSTSTIQGTSIDGTTGINTGAAGGTQRINSSGNLVNIGTVTTSGAINSQTISSAANFTGTVTVQGASSLTLGTATTNTGAILLKNASNSNTLTLQSGATGSNLTLTLPTADGINGDCLLTNGSGVLSFGTCTGGGGGSSGVTSLDGLTGVLTINNSTGSGSAITIDNASTSAKGIASFNSTNFNVTSGAVNTKQDIATTSSPTFVATTLTGSGPSLVVNGAPTGNPSGATSSLVQLGNALSNGNNATNGGTYLGLNAPSSGAGSAADFLNFQVNGAYKLKVNNAGLLDAVGGLAVNGTTVVDSSLAIQSGVTASTNLLTSGTLGVARGGTGVASYTIGDLLYASGSTTLSKLADVATGQILISGGVGVAPSWSGSPTLSGALTIQGTNALTLGTASTNTGAILFKGSGGTGTLTLKGPTTPNAGNFTLTIPAITGNANVCTDNTPICTGYAPSTGGNYIAKNLQDSSSASVTANLLALSNTNTGAFSGVLSLTGFGTNNALSVVQSASTTSEPALGKALIVANNNTTTPTGNLLDLQNKGTSKFSVDVDGSATAYGSLSVLNGINVGLISSTSTITMGNIYVQGGDFAGTNITGAATTNNTVFNLALPTLGNNATFCTSDNAYLCPSYIQNQSASAQSSNFNIVSTSLTTTTATIKSLAIGLNAQTSNLLDFQGNNGTVNGSISSTGNELLLGGSFVDGKLSLRNAGGSASYGHLKVDALTTDRTYLLPDETVGSNTICLQSSSSCGFLTSTTGIPDSTSIATENIYMTNGGSTSDVTLRIQRSASQSGNLLEFCSTSGCGSPIASVNTSGGASLFSLQVANSITGNTINGATISTNSFAGATITSSTFNNQTLSANALTFSGTPVISPTSTSNDITLQSGGTGAVNIATTGTGALTMGSTIQTGIVTLDQSTKSHTLNIGTGVTENAATLTIHIGDGGAAGSTTNITIGSAIAGTLTVKSAATFNKALTVGGHIIGANTSGSTTVAANTAVCGTGCTVTISGNDTSGLITVNTGTGVTAGTLATVTFASDYGAAPRVILTPETVPASSNFPQYYYGVGTHTFDLKSYNALSDSKTGSSAYTFSYHIIQ